MRRPALQDALQRDRGGSSAPVHLPAPVKGWNTRDPVAQMDPLYALQLDNLFPTEGEVQLRGGYVNWVQGLINPVKSLALYEGASGSAALFACTDTGIYDVSSAGAAPAASAVLTNGFWDWVNFNNSVGTTFLWGCNGIDHPFMFDGSTWTELTGVSTPAITGISNTRNIVSPWVFARRIFFIEKNTMNAWFLPVDSIAGLAKKLPIGGLFKRGGYLVAGTAWTVDGGDGSNDLCVFLTSEGEVAVYQGTNPESASSWSLTGVYYIGRPANRRCFHKLGADVVVLTEIGALPLSRALTSADINQATALSDAIRPTIQAQMGLHFSETQWQVALFSAKNALILNIPQGSGVYFQYVMNTITGAWCSFSGWNALCFVPFRGELFFGTADGRVGLAWTITGSGDVGGDIVATVQTAFSTFGSAGRVKKLEQFRPMITVDRNVTLGWGFVSDYRVPKITSYYDTPLGNFPLWDIALWDVSFWATEPFRFLRWLTASSKEGYALSVILQMTTQGANVSWSGTDYILNGGGLL